MFFVLFVLLVAAIPYGVHRRYEGTFIPSESMAPTLLPGDYLLLDRSIREPARGDIIVFADSGDPDELLIKRVIGLGGEEVHVARNHVFIGCEPEAAGCQPLAEPYADFTDMPIGPEKQGTWKVPAGGYFVMADNRNAGEDSRHYGAVRWEQIRGRPFLIYWSSDPDGSGIRWSRIGSRFHQ